MHDPYIDLTPKEALSYAREQGSQEEAWDYLDRYLRWRLVAYLQQRNGSRTELESAIVTATRWARSAGDTRREASWRQLLELMRDAQRTPADAVDLETLRSPEGRAAEVLAAIARLKQPIRPTDLARQLKMSRQQVGNLARKLEAAGLIARQKGEARASWIFATARGLHLASALPDPASRFPRQQRQTSKPTPQEVLWHPKAISSAVRF